MLLPGMNSFDQSRISELKLIMILTEKNARHFSAMDNST